MLLWAFEMIFSTSSFSFKFFNALLREIYAFFQRSTFGNNVSSNDSSSSSVNTDFIFNLAKLMNIYIWQLIQLNKKKNYIKKKFQLFRKKEGEMAECKLLNQNFNRKKKEEKKWFFVISYNNNNGQYSKKFLSISWKVLNIWSTVRFRHPKWIDR